MTRTLAYRDDLVARIEVEMDLRVANARALDRVARALATGTDGRALLGPDDGESGREMVCDLATGVGKTYLAVGLVDYLAQQGVRNVLIVVPNATIYEKTVRNFTPGDAKYVAGGRVEPLLITPDNFLRGQVGAALHDDQQLKVFVFTVQTLLAPTAKTSRRARKDNETIGESLYAHLRAAEDLVVIADEHHMYRRKAKAFSAAIRDLTPWALVGLTATPDRADLDARIFQYTLAQAIKDELVKVPVIVYRGDKVRDQQTQIVDACRLRDAKEPAWRAFAEQSGRPAVAPVLFVVCQDIAEAEYWASVLRGPELLPGEGQVLVVTARSEDADLAALAAVEEPGSAVRAIVSVNSWAWAGTSGTWP